MISKEHRFHGLHSLDHVYRSGSRAKEGALAIRSYPAKRADYRLAVVVSKKVHKSAVTRNRIRRRLYECVRVVKKDSAEKWPFDIILTVFDESVANVPAKDIEIAVKKLLEKAKIVKT